MKQKNNTTAWRILNWITRLVLVFVLSFSAINHLHNPFRFVAQIAAYQLTPTSVTIITAAFLPIFQVVLASGLIFERLSRASSMLACFLMIIFLAAQATVFIRGEVVGCGCFGEYSMPVGIKSIFVTFSFLACGMLATIPVSKGN